MASELVPQPRARSCAARLLRFACALTLLAACAPSESAPRDASSAQRGEPLDFAFGALDGSVVTGEGTRGRATALLFVTTYDLSSQVAAKRLDEAERTRKPRFNAACVALEAAENSVLVETFRDTLHLSYPIAIADSVELRASSAFSQIDRVPTLIVLDRLGRERARRYGLFELKELTNWLSAAER